MLIALVRVKRDADRQLQRRYAQGGHLLDVRTRVRCLILFGVLRCLSGVPLSGAVPLEECLVVAVDRLDLGPPTDHAELNASLFEEHAILGIDRQYERRSFVRWRCSSSIQSGGAPTSLIGRVWQWLTCPFAKNRLSEVTSRFGVWNQSSISVR